ncbi:MAG: hypothetical protein K1X89_08415 [Myxococcaceae bacterium]|nr:hypothetical protein [Myxococcaceae bacterium]
MSPRVLAATLALSASLAHASSIAVWTHGTGPALPAKALLDLETLPSEVKELADPQYDGERRWYRGVALQAVLERTPPGPGVDLALLHFQNGMVIPVPFQDPAVLKKLGVFVALATSYGAPDSGFVDTFEPAAKPGAQKTDRRPLRFDGNKLVVSSAWHPMVTAKASATFNPWRFADSLVAIEYVDEAAWYGQFEVSQATRAGAASFRGRCQFCHGARKVGAGYGWDFVEPYPLYKHRQSGSLLLHTKYRELDAAERGLMMPAFAEITAPEVEGLWQWLEAIGTQGLKPYRVKPR